MSSKKHTVPWKVIAGIGVGLIVLIIGFMIFSGSDGQEVDRLSKSVEVEDQSGITVEVISKPVEDHALTYEEVELMPVDGSGSHGTARRGQSGDLFTHVIVADLPAIETQYYYYEGWLVRPGIVDFFSTGELFAREDGKWGIIWEVHDDVAPDNLELFTEVVITLEIRDDNHAPSAHHVLEGEF
ncbi:MAG: hypothetical protein UU40_C0028G0002 [Candidatus Uhrbacteria bacterium GW2011_GWD2_41_121]|uniref:Uncharacterized protein n=1 Tax=Candidatus Uhrbacteria bacterium GW2011_GWC1_41_20 TaxID=1618983 RepID=A0A0G0XN14_9BACT|nr:MAG: hypothetical protein UT52_C0032G0006 [Candidatus Uhrbacteria bacterium GW2011_GWE1_39_46]KKR63034.1 MAG: hypothetical protein UU04_C0030G0003 [Candidatus Uhrbacteria bacterium GW2011_GWC2_40_450]KKR89392.1 MAG: hypothetical protein UU40_C0028G0002 [Candidatus Uhrbacteria bacterium GW2011_GWD2_41_121]KKR94171.1 MAG: hypothetical protein UU46_C0038G0003 [Candidatus Uhrbacteria bacterium GW2011_GWD1_41_16]KKR98185.1 MAG: hypothetical protein UU50_C0020G0003 [Candidatus Uhrbacteria bacteriu